jgi:hypothetical protein
LLACGFILLFVPIMLDTHLAVVKCSFNGKIVHIRICASCHLQLLDGADAALGMQDEDGDILLALETVNGSGSGLVSVRAIIV